MTTTPNEVPKTGDATASLSSPSNTTSNNQQSNNNASNGDNIKMSTVADIFHAAGFAFKKLSELIQAMDPAYSESAPASDGNDEPKFQTHWDQTDVEHFSTIVNNFTDDLNQLSENLKNKMANRLREEHQQAKMKTLTTQEQQMINEHQ